MEPSLKIVRNKSSNNLFLFETILSKRKSILCDCLVPKILPQKIKDNLAFMAEMRNENIQRLIKYTSLIQPYFLRHVAFKNGRRNVSSDMVKIRQGLVMVHQILIYLK